MCASPKIEIQKSKIKNDSRCAQCIRNLSAGQHVHAQEPPPPFETAGIAIVGIEHGQRRTGMRTAHVPPSLSKRRDMLQLAGPMEGSLTRNDVQAGVSDIDAHDVGLSKTRVILVLRFNAPMAVCKSIVSFQELKQIKLEPGPVQKVGDTFHFPSARRAFRKE